MLYEYIVIEFMNIIIMIIIIIIIMIIKTGNLRLCIMRYKEWGIVF